MSMMPGIMAWSQAGYPRVEKKDEEEDAKMEEDERSQGQSDYLLITNQLFVNWFRRWRRRRWKRRHQGRNELRTWGHSQGHPLSIEVRVHGERQESPGWKTVCHVYLMFTSCLPCVSCIIVTCFIMFTIMFIMSDHHDVYPFIMSDHHVYLVYCVCQVRTAVANFRPESVYGFRSGFQEMLLLTSKDKLNIFHKSLLWKSSWDLMSAWHDTDM